MSRSALKRETVVRPSRGWCRAVVQLPLLGLAFLIVACATQDSSQPLEYDEARTQRLFSIGYEDIQSIYIEDVLIADLAEAGLDGLGTIDPAVEVVEDDRRVALLRNGENIGGVALPLLNDTDGWGEATARLITLGRNNSPTLAAAEPEAIYEEIFTSMLSELDGFSRYAGRDAAQENRASRDGFGGIGVRIRLIDQGVKIMSVMEDTPAEEAGLQQNDVIVAIDGVPVEGMSQHDVVSRLRGSLHSIVALTVAREESPRPLAID
ncbi:MAG TPA: PDZ domain-containing protein, partial [Kiloniellaceae bacterium]|nr:PDZ domain-containing protein [Kiloniellaceae bacterium]